MESWRSRKTLILSRTDMIGLVTPAEYVTCVEQAYRMHGEGRYYMDPKGHIVLDKYPGEWEAMPSYIEEPEAAACKWVSIRERNREKFDLPTVFSILIYTHPETGFPLAICDGSYHTVMRTGASAAVSAKWLARKNSKKLAIVGAGHMAEGTLATCDAVFAWDEVRIWSRSQSTLDAFVKSQGPKYPRFPIHASRNLEEVVRGADVVVTVTPAREPLVKDEWIAPGTHIAALGADKGGDQELDPRIVQRSRIFVDDIRQCRTDGEINVPLAKGLIREEDIAGEIGEVVAGKKPGRRRDHAVRLDGHRAAGFGDRSARIRTGGRRRRRHREKDDFNVTVGINADGAMRCGHERPLRPPGRYVLILKFRVVARTVPHKSSAPPETL
jgi:alanine dehydrogenase